MSCWEGNDVRGPLFTHSATTTITHINASALVTITWLALKSNVKAPPVKVQVLKIHWFWQCCKSWLFPKYVEKKQRPYWGLINSKTWITWECIGFWSSKCISHIYMAKIQIKFWIPHGDCHCISGWSLVKIESL